MSGPLPPLPALLMERSWLASHKDCRTHKWKHSQITNHAVANISCHCQKYPVPHQQADKQGKPRHQAFISLMGH